MLSNLHLHVHSILLTEKKLEKAGPFINFGNWATNSRPFVQKFPARVSKLLFFVHRNNSIRNCFLRSICFFLIRDIQSAFYVSIEVFYWKKRYLFEKLCFLNTFWTLHEKFQGFCGKFFGVVVELHSICSYEHTDEFFFWKL